MAKANRRTRRGSSTSSSAANAPRLEGLRYSVLALGDLSYKHFCQIGKDFDHQLEALGAQRLHERVDCDVDYRDAANDWMEAVLRALAGDQSLATAGNAPVAAAAPSLPVRCHVPAPAAIDTYSRENPFHAEVLENFTLNGRGSDKETRFLKLSLDPSGLSFEPGDSLGIFPQNRPSLVDDFIAEMRWNAEELVPAGKEEMPLREALLKRYEITRLTRPLLQKAAEFSRNGLHELVHRRSDEELDAYVEGRDLIDLARDFSLVGIPPRNFVRGLRRIPARLYSISSSCQANPGELDLTISVLRYRAHQRDRVGAARAIAPSASGRAIACPCMSTAIRTFACRPIPTCRSSWWGPARESRRFARFSNSARRLAQAAGRGSSSATATSAPTSSINSIGSVGGSKAF